MSSAVSQLQSAAVAAVASSNEAAKSEKRSGVSGKTIGNPTLTEKGQKYYEELKRKFSDMDFILVSEDMKATAKAQASSYANPNKMVVLIDEEKLERMAEDESYRKQYEGIISSAKGKFSQMSKSLAASGANVKTFGMQINDNGAASFFAVMNKSFASQNDRIAKRTAERKAEAKKAAKKEAKEAANEARSNKSNKYSGIDEDEDTITITASSMEELLQKINDMMMGQRSDMVQTEQEKMIGQHFDSRW